MERRCGVGAGFGIYIYGQCGVGVGEVGVWGGRTSGDPLISPRHASPGRMRQTIHFKVTDTAYIAHTPSIAFRHPAPRKEGCRKAMLGVCIRCLGGGQSGRGGNGVGAENGNHFPCFLMDLPASLSFSLTVLFPH